MSGNNKVWQKFNFTGVSTSKIRVLTNASPDGYSRLTEVEAWGVLGGGSSSTNINWLGNGSVGHAAHGV